MKTHEATLDLFVRFRVISWIVLLRAGNNVNAKLDQHPFPFTVDSTRSRSARPREHYSPAERCLPAGLRLRFARPYARAGRALARDRRCSNFLRPGEINREYYSGFP